MIGDTNGRWWEYMDRGASSDIEEEARSLSAFHAKLHASGTIHFVERRTDGFYLLWPPFPVKSGDTVCFQARLLPEWFDVPKMAIGERVQG